MLKSFVAFAACLAMVADALPARGESPTLESRLLAESPATLAAEAQQTGDPRRGAKIFFQPHLACAKCHAQAETTNPLGPDLTRWERQRPPSK